MGNSWLYNNDGGRALMTQSQAKKILINAFSALNKRQRGNFAYRLEHGTPIACGDKSHLFVTAEGEA